MATVERSIEIRAPVEDVFAAATDPRRGPDWNPHVHDVTGVSLPVRVGSTWQQTVTAMGRPIRLSCRIVRFEPPHLGELEISGEQQGHIWTQFEAVEGGTRVSQRLDITPPGGILGRMMGGMIEGALGSELEQTLRRMKTTLEMERGTNGTGAAR